MGMAVQVIRRAEVAVWQAGTTSWVPGKARTLARARMQHSHAPLHTHAGEDESEEDEDEVSDGDKSGGREGKEAHKAGKKRAGVKEMAQDDEKEEDEDDEEEQEEEKTAGGFSSIFGFASSETASERKGNETEVHAHSVLA